MHRRVQVEVEWFIALSDAGFAEFAAVEAARGLLRSLVVRFSEADAQAIKDIEKTTNHDVKAVEYWLKGRFKGQPNWSAAEFVHFACTSEDINNTSHALMLQAAREQVLLPALDRCWPAGADGAHLAARAHAQPHARPDRQPHHGGQGSGQRGWRGWPRRARASPPCRCWPR
jgi:adenylosuccinate lyase